LAHFNDLDDNVNDDVLDDVSVGLVIINFEHVHANRIKGIFDISSLGTQ
jgi:hypothetical protein